MGARGPVPKRSAERRRRNKESQPENVRPLTEKVDAPAADPGWHVIARDWYESLRESGQAQFYEPSDWQAARFVAEAMTRLLGQTRGFNANLMAALWSAMADLLTTEGARRRARLEIDRSDKPPVPAGVTALAEYRGRLGG